MNPQYISRNDISNEELAKLREITVDSALNDATTLPKPILNKLIDKAINEKLWSDDDINNFNEHKNNMNYVWNFLSDAAKAKLVSLQWQTRSLSWLRRCSTDLLRVVYLSS